MAEGEPIELTRERVRAAGARSCATRTRCSSGEQLLARVWGYDFDPGSNVVEVYVGYLRRKLGAAHITNRARHGLPVRALVVLINPQDLARARVDVHVGVVREADLPDELPVVGVEVGVGELRVAGARGRRRVARRRRLTAGLGDLRCRGRRGASLVTLLPLRATSFCVPSANVTSQWLTFAVELVRLGADALGRGLHGADRVG